MARIAFAVLALALIAAVPAAHAVTLITDTMSSPYVGFTGPLGGGKDVVSPAPLSASLSLLLDITISLGTVALMI